MTKVKSTTNRSVKSTTTAEQSAAIIPEDQRYQMIAEAAYFLAEKRGFSGDGHINDWFQGEMEIDHLLKESRQ